MQHDPRLPCAQLNWNEQGQPLSDKYDDVYFSRESGLDESRYVFIQHNRLSERFNQLDEQQCFVVGETGFGTGLNFLACWQSFLQDAPKQARLHFISVEKHPLQPADLQQALALWPELSSFSKQLQRQYLIIQPGFQHMVLQQGRIRLTLLIGEASEQLTQLNAQVDAWFLDGFAPSKNPDMWSEALFSQLARLSKPGTTLATFTSAGFVRRGLQAAGFVMQRQPGFGRKREMLSGMFSGQPAAVTCPPWFARPAAPATMHSGPADASTKEQSERHAIIIGAGISGCASAYSLAQRGWRVSLIERHAQIAQEASGNPQGMLYLKLSPHPTELTQLILAGFAYTRRLLGQWPDNPHLSMCGLLQLAHNEKEQLRQQKLATAYSQDLLQLLDAQQASRQAGVNLEQSALFYPDSGWLSPAELCRLLIQHERIQLITGHHISHLTRHAEQWQAYAGVSLISQAPVVIVANAHQASHLQQTQHLPLKAIHGQTSQVPATTASLQLRSVLCGEGYIAPAHQQQHCLGASFDFTRTDTRLNRADQQGNLQRLQQISPALYQALEIEPQELALSGHAALRCTSPDYLPIIGPLADPRQLESYYGALRKNARARLDTPCPWLPGLYVNTAHGSRGLISAPLAGEMLAAWINQEPQVVPENLLQACHPNRFTIRALKKG